MSEHIYTITFDMNKNAGTLGGMVRAYQRLVKKPVNDIEHDRGLFLLEQIMSYAESMKLFHIPKKRKGHNTTPIKYVYKGIHFKSGLSLCAHLGVEKPGCSPRRTIDKYIKEHPGADIHIIK